MQHAEPCETTALCPCVGLPGGLQYCRSVPYKPFPCSLSEANLQTAAFSIRSGFWRCVGGFFFFAIFQRRGRGEWRDEGDREAGLQLNVSCASHSAVQSVHRFISNNVLNHAHEDLLPVGDNLKKVTVACGGKSNPSVFLTNELWDEGWLALFWLQVQS